MKQLILLGFAGATISSQAATTVFADGNFNTVWNTVTPTNGTIADLDAGGGGSQTTTVTINGGNPNAFLNILLSIGSGERVVSSFSWRDDFTIDPAVVGGITNIGYSFDAKRGDATNSGNAQAFGMAIRQNGIHYYNYKSSILTTWNNYADSSFTPAELTVYGGQVDEAAAGGFEVPDFSATGAPITFGYMRYNSTLSSSVFVNGEMDNYEVTVEHNIVPEPSAAQMAMVGLLVGTIFLRRRG